VLVVHLHLVLAVLAHALEPATQWQLALAHALDAVLSRWASAFVLAPVVFVLAAAILHALK